MKRICFIDTSHINTINKKYIDSSYFDTIFAPTENIPIDVGITIFEDNKFTIYNINIIYKIINQDIDIETKIKLSGELIKVEPIDDKFYSKTYYKFEDNTIIEQTLKNRNIYNFLTLFYPDLQTVKTNDNNPLQLIYNMYKQDLINIINKYITINNLVEYLNSIFTEEDVIFHNGGITEIELLKQNFILYNLIDFAEFEKNCKISRQLPINSYSYSFVETFYSCLIVFMFLKEKIKTKTNIDIITNNIVNYKHFMDVNNKIKILNKIKKIVFKEIKNS